MFINLVVYTNTDYLDILKIQTDYVSKYENTTLFINKNSLVLENIYSKYKNVIFYDNSKTYASRLLECIQQLDDKYFLFTHDIDILLQLDEQKIKSIYDSMLKMGIDRVDLKYTDKINQNLVLNYDDCLVEEKDINNYIYNVNPSIWKKESLVEILKNFSYKNYRDIESLDVQMYCTKFNIYKIYSKKYLNCGYFKCVPFYKFLHITHSGKILPLNNEKITEFGQSYEDALEDFLKIVEKFNLKHSSKWRK